MPSQVVIEPFPVTFSMASLLVAGERARGWLRPSDPHRKMAFGKAVAALQFPLADQKIK
jgi:hypothetical protein